jgi:hypothetical protein
VGLVDVGLRYVNEIAQVTDVGRLLLARVNIGDLAASPPDDSVFGSEVRRRIDALG